MVAFILTSILLFYVLAILQNSFFSHFSFFSTIPNLVFILFFTLVFFSKNKSNLYTIYLGFVAGFLLDVFAYFSFGTSIVSLVVIGFLIKKAQKMIDDAKGEKTLGQFLVLFTLTFLLYSIVISVVINTVSIKIILTDFNLKFLAEIFYNIVFAIISFFAYKKIAKKKKW